MYKYDSKLLKLVADETKKSIFGLIIVTIVFIWAYIDFIPFEYIVVWSFAQFIFIISRYINGQMLSKYIEEKNVQKIKIHTQFFAFIVIFSSFLWSLGTLAGAVFAPTPYEFVSFIMVIGLITGAVVSLTPVFKVFVVYFIIMILTQFSIMLYFGTNAHIALVLFSLVYMPVIVLLSKSIYKNHITNIKSHDILEAHISKLKEISITDSLTKTYNRRYFFEAAHTLVLISKREKSEVSFLMIDIDYFKNVNDTYGHQVGDYILVWLAKEIKSMVRESDIFARLGGEEFALLLHNTSLKGAKIIAEKIRSTIEKMEFDDNYISDGITVSIGCSALSNRLTTLEELYQDADKKLYIAKELGRNRVQ